MKSRLRSYIVLLVTVVLLYLVFDRVGIDNLLLTLRGVDYFWLTISILISPLIILVSVIRWQVLLRSQGANVSLSRLYVLYMIGRFFNYFLPSNIGGDVVRGYELGKHLHNGVDAMASVFMDRLTGFVMLVVLAVLAALLNLASIRDSGLVLALILSVLLLIAVLWFVLDPRPVRVISRWGVSTPINKYLVKLQQFHTSINAFKNRKRVIVIALFWSLVFMLLAIANVYTSALAFYTPVSFSDMSIIVPIILVVSMFPLTINGLGLQEWAYVFLFSSFGLPETVGLSTIVLIRGKDILISILGGIFYIFLKIKNNQTPSQGYDDQADHIYEKV